MISNSVTRVVYLQVALLSRIHHRNLVPLIGYCEDEHQRLLVYEYMHNGTLRNHIHGLIFCRYFNNLVFYHFLLSAAMETTN